MQNILKREEALKNLSLDFRKKLHIFEKGSGEPPSVLLDRYKKIKTYLSVEEIEWAESILFHKKITQNKNTDFLIPEIKTRRSVRKWIQIAVPVKSLSIILESGLYAPSSCNRQPIEFVVLQKDSLIAEISRLKHQKFMAEAPCIIAVLVNQSSYKKEGDKEYFSCLDAAACIQNMLLTIDKLGLGGCWVNASKEEHGYEVFRNLLCLPDYLFLASFVLVGYPSIQPIMPIRKQLIWKDNYYE